jgi:hypothetical protein
MRSLELDLGDFIGKERKMLSCDTAWESSVRPL